VSRGPGLYAFCLRQNASTFRKTTLGDARLECKNAEGLSPRSRKLSVNGSNLRKLFALEETNLSASIDRPCHRKQPTQESENLKVQEWPLSLTSTSTLHSPKWNFHWNSIPAGLLRSWVHLN